MELLLTVCVTSLVVGVVYALFAAGLDLVLACAGEVNLAHGDSLMLATYVAAGTQHLTTARPLAVLAAVGMGAAIGVVAYLLVFGPLQRLGAGGLLPALGVALVVRNLAEHFWPRANEPLHALVGGPRLHLFYDFRLSPVALWLALVAVAVPFVGRTFRRTTAARRLRLVADDPVLARLSGVPVTSTLAVSYALAGALGGLTGALYASLLGIVFVGLGWQATLKGFVAAVLGGAGRLRGALWGGLVLGALESFSGAYISSTYRDAVTFMALVVVLVAAPGGLTRTFRRERALI